MNTAMARMLIVSGVTGLLCTTTSLPANASLPGNGYYNWNYGATSYGNIPSVDTGIKVSDMTCFLSRIAGDLDVTSGYAAVSVEQVYGEADWWLRYGNTNGSVQASIACIWNDTSPNVVTRSLTGSGPLTITGTDSSSQCFLQSIYAFDTSFSSSSAKVVLGRDGSGTWTLTNTSVSTDVTVTVVCVDVPGASWYMENNWTGNFTVTALEQTSTAPEVCGLRGIGGSFTGSSDSVGVYGPSSLPGYWSLQTTGSDAGWITCLQ